MNWPIYVVDAFTDRAFAGNPAAVCLLQKNQSDEWFQQVAAEMNLSETAFLLPHADGYSLRWFTPTVEVDLCGHATLASAHVLWESNQTTATMISFSTRSGLLKAEKQAHGIELDFPSLPVQECPTPTELVEALTVPFNFVGTSGMDYLCEVQNEKTLRHLQPNMEHLTKIKTRGVIVTCRSEQSKFDFLSRFFAPAAGVPEDPVTGSAHCALAPYWAAKLGRTELVGYQASHRGGVVRVRLEHNRVRLGGQAITVLKGELLGHS